MPRPSYVVILDLGSLERKTKRFNTMSEAIHYVKSYPCRGHVVYAERYDTILAFKSDVTGFASLKNERISYNKI